MWTDSVVVVGGSEGEVHLLPIVPRGDSGGATASVGQMYAMARFRVVSCRVWDDVLGSVVNGYLGMWFLVRGYLGCAFLWVSCEWISRKHMQGIHTQALDVLPWMCFLVGLL